MRAVEKHSGRGFCSGAFKIAIRIVEIILHNFSRYELSQIRGYYSVNFRIVYGHEMHRKNLRVM